MILHLRNQGLAENFEASSMCGRLLEDGVLTKMAPKDEALELGDGGVSLGSNLFFVSSVSNAESG